MAQNYVQPGRQINAVPTAPAAPLSGIAVLVGTIAGVALTNCGEGGNVVGACTIATKGVFNLPVHGHDGTDPVAIANGDRLYYDSVIEEINANMAGAPFGKSLGTVVEDATTTIPVLLIQA